MSIEQRSDVSSLEEVFRRDWATLWRLAALLVGDRSRAEELVMDAFATSLRDWHRVRDPSAASAYLRAAVVNRCRNHLRRRRTEWRVNALHTARPVPEAELPEVDHEVLAAVRALPPRQRMAVVLTYFADLSEADVAAALGVAPGTVKSQLAKARRTLAATLQESS